MQRSNSLFKDSPSLLNTFIPSPLPIKKRRLLVWADSCTASTGFGNVARYIMQGLQSTGLYEIDQLAINFKGEFYDKNLYPYNLLPARLNNPQDPYGSQMFADALIGQDYDMVLVINDTFVVENVSTKIEEIRNLKRQKNKKLFKLIYYYPVDCRFMTQASTMVKIADCAVAYTNFAKEETLRVLPEKQLEVIYHGIDTEKFFPILEPERTKFRKAVFGIEDSDTFLWISVNRNSVRKDIARTILAFSEFKKQVPNSKIYIHTRIQDGTQGVIFDLSVAIQHLGLVMNKDIIFPNQETYSVVKGFPIEILNKLYNAGDGFIATNLGEGWGLCLDSSTIIDTSNHPVAIKDIQIGDKVVGQDGKFHRVLDKISRKVDKVYEVKAMSALPILSTKEHPFFVLQKKSTQPQWLSVDQINIGDFLAISKYKEDQLLPSSLDLLDYLDKSKVLYNDKFIWYKMGYSPKTNGLSISDIQNKYNVSKRVAEDARRILINTSLPSRGLPNSIAYQVATKIKQDGLDPNTSMLKISRFIPINDSFLYFIGWYLAEGSNGGNTRIEIDLHSLELSVAKQHACFFKEYFNVEPIVEQNGLNKCRMRISSQVLAEIFGKLCGVHAPNKKIPSFLLKSPAKLGLVLRGLFEGDGNIDFKNRSISLTTTSISLVYQCRMICSAMDILLNINCSESRLGNYPIYDCRIATPCLEKWKTFTTQEVLVRSINRKSAQHFFEDKDYFFIEVKDIKIINGEREVFDICVENSHSFMANGILAHNTNTESMGAGVPVITGAHTSQNEIFGQNSERGYLYPCKEQIYIDNSGFRLWGQMSDIQNSMMSCYTDWKEKSSRRIEIIKQARSFAEQYSWKNVCKDWVNLFEKVYNQPDIFSENPIAGEKL